MDDAGQPDRLAGELAALQAGAGGGRVALVEDEVEHVQHGAQPVDPVRARRQGERRAGGPDERLAAADALRHRRLGDQEGAGDLRRGEAADRAQGQRDLRRRRERGVAAHEQQGERVVLLGGRRRAGRRRDPVLRPRLRRVGVLALPARVLAARLVGHAPRRDGDQPGARALGEPVRGPLRRGRQERLLDGVLAGVEPAVAPDEHAEDLRRELAQQVLDAGVGAHISVPAVSISGRSSTAAKRALGQRAAISVARSTLSQSSRR